MADDTNLLLQLSAIDNITPAVLRACETLDQINTKIANLGASSDTTAKQAEGLNTSWINFAAGMEIVNGVVEDAKKVWDLLSEPILKSIEAASVFQQSQNLLSGALISTGLNTSDLSGDLVEYAEETSKASGVTAAAITNHIALGIQMGLSAEKSQEMEEASRKLATLMGGDVDKAFNALRQSLAGHSRGLALVLPQVKELGVAQLTAGDAIDLVNTKAEASYELYQGSYQAGVNRAKVAMEELYVSIGDIIIQNPLVNAAVQAFADIVSYAADGVKTFGQWLTTHSDTLQRLGVVVLEVTGGITAFYVAMGLINTVVPFASLVMYALTTSISLYGVAGTIAVNTTALLTGALALLTSPVTLTIAAVVALGAALYKWPGIVDQVKGSLEILIGGALLPFTAIIGAVIIGVGALTEVFDQKLGKAIEATGTGLIALNMKLITSGAASVKYGTDHMTASEKVVDGNAAEEASLEKLLSELENYEVWLEQNSPKMYGAYEIGTLKQRTALDGQAQDRAKDLTEFTKYYNDKIALAVSKEDEQAAQVASYKAKALGGSKTGGSTGTSAEAQAAVLAEQNKQTQLKQLRADGIINDQEYEQAILMSQQRANTARLTDATANQAAMAALMGKSKTARDLSLNQATAQRALEEQQAMQSARQLGASQQQLDALKIEQEQQTTEKLSAIKVKFAQDEETRQRAQNNALGVLQQQMIVAQEKEGVMLGTLHAVQNSTIYQQEDQMLGNLASLRSSHSKTAFDIGQKAAIAQATVHTFLSATEAFASLAGIPIVGPALGAAAAAAAVAAGFVQIQGIEAQKFSAAHGGLDDVPSDMDNTTFLLKAGERVVQPQANTDLTNFLAAQKTGAVTGPAAASSTPVIVNLTVNGTASKDDMRKTTTMLITELRRASERGDLIISAKGVY